ncbi:hypothetical protein BpHYR1_002026 [Brachionus plicatilis]|uniref:Uncharacterized protein n=1 Tax=Brachionus plicatilis TaxID=10195 RepID=A0A3M7RB48_BRAPC|nr:hypothetical protein BpHYR1_002026 [Brachionus plicatilis]
MSLLSSGRHRYVSLDALSTHMVMLHIRLTPELQLMVHTGLRITLKSHILTVWSSLEVAILSSPTNMALLTLRLCAW